MPHLLLISSQSDDLIHVFDRNSHFMTNRAAPDQLASNWSSSEANWSGSTLFAKTGHVVFSKRRVKNDRLIIYYLCHLSFEFVHIFLKNYPYLNIPCKEKYDCMNFLGWTNFPQRTYSCWVWTQLLNIVIKHFDGLSTGSNAVRVYRKFWRRGKPNTSVKTL